MKYFLDSAKIDEIRYARENWKIEGVTTNPRHIKASGKPFYSVIKELAKEFAGPEFPISVEINPHIATAKEMIVDAEKIVKLSENFVIKVPATEQGFIAAKKMSENGIKVNLTLVFTPSQALQAARIGCNYVSPFIGWQESSGVECTDLLVTIVTMYQNYGFETEIIVAAVRTAKQIVDAATIGCDIVTAGYDVYKDSFAHPFTDQGLKLFSDAWDATEIGKI